MVEPSVLCPSCKVTSRERLTCQKCTMSFLDEEKEAHERQRQQRDEKKNELDEFLQDNLQSAMLALETNRLEEENTRLRELVQEGKQKLAMLQDKRRSCSDRLDKQRKDLRHAKERMAKAVVYDRDVVEPIIDSVEDAAGRLEESVAHERRKKMDQLHSIFPLDLSGPGQGYNTICSIPMEDLSDRYRASLALVLIARVVVLSAYYLRLNLPWKIVYEKGEAWILHRNETVLLHPNKKLAVAMLQVDIRMLCIAQGVPVNALSKTGLIENMWQLFHSPSLGRPARVAMLDGKLRESRAVSSSSSDPSKKPSRSAGAAAQSGSSSARGSKRKQHEEEDDFVVVERPGGEFS